MKIKLLLATLLAFASADFASAKEQVPFKGSLAGHEIDVVEFPTLFGSLSATGNATHLGRFTMTLQVQVDVTTGMSVGTIRFIAANGDSIFAVFAGQGTPTSEPNVSSIVEVATITGGTGRFEGATGSFTLQRVINLATGVSSGSFTGTISRVRKH